MRSGSIVILAALLPTALIQSAPAQVCESSRLEPADAGSGDQFGFAVSGFESLAAAGSPFDNELGGNSGSVTLFRFNGLEWLQETRLLADDGVSSDFFGAAVAAGEDLVLVGAPLDDDAGISTGAVYVFRFDGFRWSQEAKLVPDDANGQEEFGTAIALDGSTAIIGAFREDLPSAGNAGAAYVFEFDGAAWIQRAKLTADDAFADDGFGRAVDLDGNLAVIGAPFDDDGGSGSGSAYVFRRAGMTWQQEAKLDDPDGDFNDFLGRGAAIDGTVAALGAPGDVTRGPGGSVKIFRRAAGNWSLESVIPSPNGFGNFGIAVAAESGRLLVGNPGIDNNPVAGLGHQYLFDGLDWVAGPILAPTGGQLTNIFGSSVALFDSRGIVGAPSHNGSFSDSGIAYVFEPLDLFDCNANGIDDSCDIATMSSLDANGDLVPDECQPVAGDTNGDGVVDATDLEPVINNFGPCPPAPEPCPGDADGNGTVDIDDIIEIIVNWTMGPIMDFEGATEQRRE